MRKLVFYLIEEMKIKVPSFIRLFYIHDASLLIVSFALVKFS